MCSIISVSGFVSLMSLMDLFEIKEGKPPEHEATENRIHPDMKAAAHEKTRMYLISPALYHLLVIFRSGKSTSNFRNPFFRRQESPHTLRGHFKDTQREFQ